jgi:hypothetical protein
MGDRYASVMWLCSVTVGEQVRRRALECEHEERSEGVEGGQWAAEHDSLVQSSDGRKAS